MEMIVLVDEQDNIVGSCEKLYTHVKGYQHRAFSVFVFNKEGKMLIQRRAKEKYHSGGLWTNSCCSHQIAGTELIDDVHDRLEFEIGIKVDDLTERFIYSYRAELDHDLIENEVDHIFTAHYDGEVTLNPDEAMDYKWVDVDQLLKDIDENPDNYTYWFKGTVHEVVDYIIDEN